MYSCWMHVENKLRGKTSKTEGPQDDLIRTPVNFFPALKPPILNAFDLHFFPLFPPFIAWFAPAHCDEQVAGGNMRSNQQGMHLFGAVYGSVNRPPPQETSADSFPSPRPQITQTRKAFLHQDAPRTWPASQSRRERKRGGRWWGWKEVNIECVTLPAGITYFVMAWAEQLHREWI
ncbi:hypothetical protein F5887DRAFT_1212511 [Amanita rubescens]|nr:hypothetical protein F5887DRAFT_1212511 [Amanita rubescens]